MSAMSDFLETSIANHVLRSTAYPSPSQLFLALCTAAPSETGSPLNETTYSGYTRIALSAPGAGSAAWSFTPGTGVAVNTGVITFPAHGGGAPVLITHWAIFDASNISPAGSGNLLFAGVMTGAGKTIEPGDVPSFPVSSIQLTFS